MPVSGCSRSVALTFDCPFCNYALVKEACWLQVPSRLKCEGCQREIRLTYDDKLALFNKRNSGRQNSN